MQLVFPPATPVNADAAGQKLLATFLEVAPLVAENQGDDSWKLPSKSAYMPGRALAWDDQLVAVNFMGLDIGIPGREQVQPVLPTQLTQYYDFQLTILRSAPNIDGAGGQGGFPPMGVLTAAGLKFAVDAKYMMATLITIHMNSLIIPAGMKAFFYGPLSTVGPQGDLAGVGIPVRFQAGFGQPPGAY